MVLGERGRRIKWEGEAEETLGGGEEGRGVVDYLRKQ